MPRTNSPANSNPFACRSADVILILILTLILSGTQNGFVQADDSLQTITLSKVPTGWTSPSGMRICNCAFPSINNAGQIFFENLNHNIFGPRLENETDWGLWRHEAGELSPVLRSGTRVSVQGGHDYLQRVSGLGAIEGDGLVFVFGSTEIVDSNYFDHLLIVDKDGSRRIAMSGGGMSGIDEEWTDAYFQQYRMSAGGHAIISATLRRPTNSGVERRDGIWFYDGSDLKLVAEQTKSLPGLKPGETIRYLYNESIAINARGESVFIANYSNADGTVVNGHGIWFRTSGGELQPLILAGEQVELGGEMKSLNISEYPGPVINNNSQVLFRSALSTSAQLPGQADSMWLQNSDGSRRLIAETGKKLAGDDQPIEFISFGTSTGDFMALNNGGRTAFNAKYYDDESTPTNVEQLANLDDIGPIPNSRTIHEGIWTEQDGNFQLVAKLGDVAPGDGRPFLALHPQAINNAGQFVFSGTLRIDELGRRVETGFWAQDRKGVLQLIAKSGQQIDVASGAEIDLRTISYLLEYIPNVLNDRGQLLLNVGFTDGTHGIFLSNAVAIPEPSSLLLVSIGIVGTFSRSARGNLRRKATRD